MLMVKIAGSIAPVTRIAAAPISFAFMGEQNTLFRFALPECVTAAITSEEIEIFPENNIRTPSGPGAYNDFRFRQI
ncbi:MAG: hypothetical protein ACQERI_07010 [Candidatus Krumholzibacteriota bacterium]